MIVGVDVGYRNCGFCLLSQDFVKFILFVSYEEDLARLYKLWNNELFFVSEALFVFIEDIVYLPKRQRKIQAMLFGQTAIILSKISDEAGYYLVSPWKVKKEVSGNLWKYFIEVNEKEREHLIDSFRVLKVGIKSMEKVPSWCFDVLSSLELNNFKNVSIERKELK